MTVIRVGAGPGDPDLLSARARAVLAEAAVVVVAPALAGLARALSRSGTPVVGPEEIDWAVAAAAGGPIVHLVAGDGFSGDAADERDRPAGPAEGEREDCGDGGDRSTGPDGSKWRDGGGGGGERSGRTGPGEGEREDGGGERDRSTGPGEGEREDGGGERNGGPGPGEGEREDGGGDRDLSTGPGEGEREDGGGERNGGTGPGEGEREDGGGERNGRTGPAEGVRPDGGDGGPASDEPGGGGRTRRLLHPPDELVPGLPGDVEGRVLAALRDLRAARPLRGLTVVVTRAAAQAAELSGPLRRRGARVIELPTIRIDPPADGGRALQAALDRIGTYQWLIVTSVNGARAVLDRLSDGRRLAGVRLAAIGPATAAALAAAHLPADLVPPRFVAESLLEVFPAGPGRVLLARAAVARDALPAGLAPLDWEVDVVEAYRTASPDLAPGLLDEVAAADVACFTAPSTFERFCELAGPDRLPPHLACIGPVTAAAVRRAGREPAVEAAVHTMPGLVDALTEWARARPAAANAGHADPTGDGTPRAGPPPTP